MPNPRLRKGHPNPYGPTGLSRSVLLQLENGPVTINQILETLGPRSDGVNRGTVYTILARAAQNGLVACNKTDANAKRPYFFELTDGGRRRVKWIRGRARKKVHEERRAVANPKAEEE